MDYRYLKVDYYNCDKCFRPLQRISQQITPKHISVQSETDLIIESNPEPIIRKEFTCPCGEKHYWFALDDDDKDEDSYQTSNKGG